MKALLVWASLIAVLACASGARAQDLSHGHASVPAAAEDTAEFVPGEQYLNGRLLAPCCWNQTLDIHGSEVTIALKREIRQRLRGGETADQIEAAMVARYGEKILAVPTKSPLKSLAVALSLAMGVAGVGAVFMLVRWRRRSKSAAPAMQPGSAAPSERDALDDRIDQELQDS